MRRTGVWQVTDKGPTELPSTTVELEKELEAARQEQVGEGRTGIGGCGGAAATRQLIEFRIDLYRALGGGWDHVSHEHATTGGFDA